MPKYLEWDFDNPKHRQRRRQPLPLEGEVLGPEPEPEPTPRIRVEVTHHRYVPRRQRSTVPPWLIVLFIIAALMWMAPLGTIILIAIVSIFVTSAPDDRFCDRRHDRVADRHRDARAVARPAVLTQGIAGAARRGEVRRLCSFNIRLLRHW